MDLGRWAVTAVLRENELDGLADPILVEDLGDGYGIYELTRADALLAFGLKSAPTEQTGERAPSTAHDQL